MHGRRCVLVTCLDGQPQLAELMQHACPERDLLAGQLQGLGQAAQGSVQLGALLVACIGARGVGPLGWLAKQLLHYIGLCFESHVRQLSAEASGPPAGALVHKGRRKDLDAVCRALQGGRS